MRVVTLLFYLGMTLMVGSIAMVLSFPVLWSSGGIGVMYAIFVALVALSVPVIVIHAIWVEFNAERFDEEVARTASKSRNK